MLFFSGFICSVLCFSRLGLCYFERGDRYWSGKPDAIGIDFSTLTATAVITDGSNFTTLALVPTREQYVLVMHRLHQELKKSPFQSVLLDDLPGISNLELWRNKVQNWITSKKTEWAEHTCSKLTKTFRPWRDSSRWLDTLEEICYPEREEYNPQPPSLRNKGFITRLRAQKRLRAMLPKWFRSAPTSSSLLKSELLVLFVDMLEEVKRIAFEDHGVVIKSAIIARPNQFYNELSDLIDEACAIAGIESWEQSQERKDMALRTIEAPDNGTVMIVDHSHFFLNIHQAQWSKEDGVYQTRGTRSEPRYGGWPILYSLVNHVIGIYNANITEEERGWPKQVGIGPLMTEVAYARLGIMYGSRWPEDMDRVNRTVSMNLTDVAGYQRQVNITGQDIADIDDLWVNKYSDIIERDLWKENEIREYGKAHSHYDEKLSWNLREKQLRSIVHTMPAPAHIGSWIAPPDHVIVMDTSIYMEVLTRAILRATGHEVVIGERGMCFPSFNYAARGAALHALKWQGYWQAEQDEENYHDDEYAEVENEEYMEHDEGYDYYDEI